MLTATWSILAAEGHKSLQQSWEKDLLGNYCAFQGCYCYVFHTHWTTIALDGSQFKIGIDYPTFGWKMPREVPDAKSYVCVLGGGCDIGWISVLSLLGETWVRSRACVAVLAPVRVRESVLLVLRLLLLALSLFGRTYRPGLSCLA